MRRLYALLVLATTGLVALNMERGPRFPLLVLAAAALFELLSDDDEGLR